MTRRTVRWSRRRWLAEYFGCDLSEVTAYQRPRDTGGVQLYQHDGHVCGVVLVGESPGTLTAALDGYSVVTDQHWRNPMVIVMRESGGVS